MAYHILQKWDGYNFYVNLPEDEFSSFREVGYAAELAKTLDKNHPELYHEYDVLWYFQLIHNPGNWHVIHDFTKPLILFVVAHECPHIPDPVIRKAAFIFKQYINPAATKKNQNVFRIPIGPSGAFPDIPLIPFRQRSRNVFFSGNLHLGRKKLYEELTGIHFLPFPILHRCRNLLGIDFSHQFPNSIISFSNKFHSGFGMEEYACQMANSKIVLCPYGVSEQETMRHFEAFKQGCVILTDQMPDTHYFRDAPYITIPKWRNLRHQIFELLNEQNFLEQKANESYQWWQSTCSVHAIVQYIKDNIECQVKCI